MNDNQLSNYQSVMASVFYHMCLGLGGIGFGLGVTGAGSCMAKGDEPFGVCSVAGRCAW